MVLSCIEIIAETKQLFKSRIVVEPVEQKSDAMDLS